MESLYHPVTIGQVQISGNLFLAPVAGYSDRAFRAVCCRGGADFAYTEMVSAEALVRGNVKTFNLMRKAPEENLYAVQLFGADPASMEQAVCIVRRNFSPDIIDINAGCPVPKITKTGAGASLTRYPERLADVVSAAVSAAECVPITVKIRSGWDHEHINAVEVAKICEEAGAQAICVHPRTRSQGYTGKADWSIIKSVKEAVSIPVIGNGDIKSCYDAKRMLEETGCDAVMIGRGVLGNPWLIKECVMYLETGEVLPKPSPKERIDMCLYHLNLLKELKNEHIACLEIRTHISWYLKGLPKANDIKNKIFSLDHISDIIQVLNEYQDWLKEEQE